MEKRPNDQCQRKNGKCKRTVVKPTHTHTHTHIPAKEKKEKREKRKEFFKYCVCMVEECSKASNACTKHKMLPKMLKEKIILGETLKKIK